MLSNTTKTEKNKLNSNSVWLVMLEISIPSVPETLRIVNNNDDDNHINLDQALVEGCSFSNYRDFKKQDVFLKIIKIDF